MIRRLFIYLFCYRPEEVMSLATQLQQLQEFEDALTHASQAAEAFETVLDRVSEKWDAFEKKLEGADIQEQTDRLKQSTDALAGSVQANQ